MDWRSAFASGDDQQAEAAAKLLVQDASTALDTLTPLIEDTDVNVRWWSARTLAELQSSLAGELLSKCLSDREIAVQQCAAVALRESPCTAAVPALLDLLDHRDSLLARLAGDALIKTGKAAVPGLVTCLAKGSLPSRQQAARCLSRICNPETIPALFKALDDSSTLVQFYAEEGLEKMGVGMTFFLP